MHLRAFCNPYGKKPMRKMSPRTIKTSESLQNYSKLHLNYNSSVFMSIRNVSTETSVQCHRVQCKPKATQILRETHKTQLQRLNEQQVCVNYLSLSTHLVRDHKNPALDVWTWIWQKHLNNTELAVARQFYSTPGQRVRQITPHTETLSIPSAYTTNCYTASQSAHLHNTLK